MGKVSGGEKDIFSYKIYSPKLKPARIHHILDVDNLEQPESLC